MQGDGSNMMSLQNIGDALFSKESITGVKENWDKEKFQHITNNPWMTIEVSARKGSAWIRSSLKRAGYKSSGDTNNMLDRLPATGKKVLDLTKISMADLGFTGSGRGFLSRNPMREMFFEAAIQHGLELFPVGALHSLVKQVSLENDECLLIAMEPIDAQGSVYRAGFCSPNVFLLYRNSGGLFLGNTDGMHDPMNGNPYESWNRDIRWIFVLPKKH